MRRFYLLSTQPNRQAIPYLTAQQMRRIDELAVEHGLSIIQMMENAGYQMADFIRKKYSSKKKVLALAGKGGNGGDALAAARHLINWGYQLTCLLASSPGKLKKEARQQYNILHSIKAKLLEYPQNQKINFSQFDLIIDGLLGYSVSGDPRPPYDELIEQANACGKPIISFDVPSGMDATTGQAYRPSIKATDTLTLALPKTCFQNPSIRNYVGSLYLVDIAVPVKVYECLGIKIPLLFDKKSIVKIKEI